MSSTRQALVLLVAALLALMLGIVGLELVFGRWLADGSWSEVERMNVVRNKAIRYDVRHIHGPQAAPVSYTRDAHGLRGACTEPAKVRVVTLGGSTTDQVYVDDAQTWQAVLERRLAEAALKQPVCVANAGVDGHTTFGHIAAMERWLPLIPGLRPDFILLYIGVNDAALRRERAPGDERASPGLWGRAKAAMQHNSALWALWRRLNRPPADEAPIFAAHKLLKPVDADYGSTRPAADIEALVAQSTVAFRERLQRLLVLIERSGAKPICVSQPSIIYRHFPEGWRGITETFKLDGRSFNGLDYRASMLALNQVMADLCPRTGGHYIDLESRPFDVGDYYDAAHMNGAGTAKVGNYLFEEFVTQRIVERWR